MEKTWRSFQKRDLVAYRMGILDDTHVKTTGEQKSLP